MPSAFNRLRHGSSELQWGYARDPSKLVLGLGLGLGLALLDAALTLAGELGEHSSQGLHMSMRQWFPIVAALTALSPRLCRAQTLDGIQPGTPVRVWTPDHRGLPATLAARGEAMSTFVTSTGDTLTVLDDHLTSLEYQYGRRSAHGAAMGTVVGGLLGLLVGSAIGNAAVSGCTEFLCELDAMPYAFGGLLAGGVFGAMIGMAYAPPAWRVADLRPGVDIGSRGGHRARIAFTGRGVAAVVRFAR